MGAPSAPDTASRAALILERNVHFDSVGYSQRPFAGDAARYALPSGTAECRPQQTATAGSEDHGESRSRRHARGDCAGLGASACGCYAADRKGYAALFPAASA